MKNKWAEILVRGQIAYESYYRNLGQELPMPFAELPKEQQKAWAWAALDAIKYALEEGKGALEGLTRRGLDYRMKQLGISAAEFRPKEAI